jgi:hypothetical protein
MISEHAAARLEAIVFGETAAAQPPEGGRTPEVPEALKADVIAAVQAVEELAAGAGPVKNLRLKNNLA